MLTLVFATQNAHKVQEMQDISEGRITLRSLSELKLSGPLPEPTNTFRGNAEAKARAVYDACGLPVIADDSGLCVDALEGAPGVFSARYAGDKASDAANVALLLRKLEDVDDPNRGAAFVCVIAMIDDAGTVRFAEGRTQGRILRQPVGQGGFGYDPVFFSFDAQAPMATLTPEAKHAISHRGRAFRALLDTLKV